MAKETFKITQSSAISLVAGERLYLTAKRDRVVREGDKDAASLLAGIGQVIPAGEAKRLGLTAATGTEPQTRSTRPAAPDLTR